MKSFVYVVTFITLVLLSGCMSNKSLPSSTNALVTPEQFAKAFSLVDDVKTYVPFNEPGICFARALFMSLALAAEEIPSSAHFVFPRDGRGHLNGPNGLKWKYHVGMMIKANDSSEKMIFGHSVRVC